MTERCNGQANHHTCHQRRLSVYGPVMRRHDQNVTKEVTTRTVVRSDMKEQQLDPELTHNREAWRNAVKAINLGKG